jgi:hypothetical protein
MPADNDTPLMGLLKIYLLPLSKTLRVSALNSALSKSKYVMSKNDEV